MECQVGLVGEEVPGYRSHEVRIGVAGREEGVSQRVSAPSGECGDRARGGGEMPVTRIWRGAA